MKKNKAVLITGATGIIGEKIALKFAKKNYDICLHFNKNLKKIKVIETNLKKFDIKVFKFKANLRDEKQVKKLFQFINKNFNKIDILINNAAIKDKNFSINNVSENKLNLFFKTNVYSIFYTIKESIKLMKHGGSIINISSLVSIRGSYKNSVYSATKSAVDNLTISSSRELKSKKIYVNSIAPGNVSIDKNIGISSDKVANIVYNLSKKSSKDYTGKIIKI